MKRLTIATLLGSALLSAAIYLPAVASAADKRTDIDCAELFKQLNTSKSGQLTQSEAQANPISRQAYADPTVAQRGYLTQAEFTAVCIGTEQTPPSGQP